MTSATLCSPQATPELDIVVSELARVSDLLLAFAGEARTLAAGTDWQARAAQAFHDRASRWAGDVSNLSYLAETARMSVASARDSARTRYEWACS
ncbi:hypothetical protein QL996_14675 [Planococcus sp. APC 4015]|nr:hypothetical protein [Planococcus sp. APC 4015]